MPISLTASAPFHLEATVRVLQRRPSNLIDTWDGRRYRRALRIGTDPVLVEVENCGTIDAPDVRLSLVPATTAASQCGHAARTANAILGLDAQTHGAEERARAQPALRRIAWALRGMRPPRYPDLFETFANVIPFQQLSLQAGMAVTARLVQRFGQLHSFGGRDYFLFPSAEAIADSPIEALKSCGLSTRKGFALRCVGRTIAEGALTAQHIDRLGTPEALERLMQLPGIGAWSAALVLLRGFGRLDVFPPADSGAENSLMRVMRLRSSASLQRVIDRFGEYRGYLYFYGIGSRLIAAGLIEPAPAGLSGAPKPAALSVPTPRRPKPR